MDVYLYDRVNRRWDVRESLDLPKEALSEDGKLSGKLVTRASSLGFREPKPESFQMVDCEAGPVYVFTLTDVTNAADGSIASMIYTGLGLAANMTVEVLNS